MRQTKIICTIGPACNNKETILKMIDAGMDVARFNMSHGDYGELEKTFATVKEAIAESGKNVALLLDTKGPEVRIGHIDGGKTEIVEGQDFTFFRDEVVGNNEGVSISYPKLIKKLMKYNKSRKYWKTELFVRFLSVVNLVLVRVSIFLITTLICLMLVRKTEKILILVSKWVSMLLQHHLSETVMMFVH